MGYRILHIWDQAGVAAVLAKYQRRMGHQADVIKRAGFDFHGIDSYYHTPLLRCSEIDFYKYAIRLARKYDVVHVHSLAKIVPLIPRPCVLHFHGGELRGVGLRRDFIKGRVTKVLAALPPTRKVINRIANTLARKAARKVLVAVPPMLVDAPEAQWLPTPVDTELFNPQVTPDATLTPPIPYGKMPQYLASLEAYHEWKLWSLSKTAYEALACGTPVIWRGLKIVGLPKRHHAENVAKRTIQVYEEILRR